jgi:hypothetical protein
MCDPVTLAAATFAVNAGSAAMEYQGQKDQAKAQAAANANARIDAQEAHTEDVTRIEAERIRNNEEAARESFKNQREKRAELASARNKAGEGTGMMYAMLRDIGFEYDMDQNLLDSGLSDANIGYMNARKDAYAAFSRNWNNQPAVNKPSAAAFGLKIAGAGLSSTATYKSGGYGKT